jgi:hypothetical protein
MLVFTNWANFNVGHLLDIGTWFNRGKDFDIDPDKIIVDL